FSGLSFLLWPKTSRLRPWLQLNTTPRDIGFRYRNSVARYFNAGRWGRLRPKYAGMNSRVFDGFPITGNSPFPPIHFIPSHQGGGPEFRHEQTVISCSAARTDSIQGD